MPCQAPCERILDCLHRCQSQCGLPCPKCTHEASEILLECNHVYEKTCSDNTETAPICKQIIETKRLDCGHSVDVICSEAHLPAVCLEKCDALQPCKHRCERACEICYLENKHETCRKHCGFKLDCGHLCEATCSHSGPHPRCVQRCPRSCSHGQCQMPCYVECDPCVKLSRMECAHQDPGEGICSLPIAQIPCSATCNKPFPCGIHFCQSRCNEDCPLVCPECEGSELSPKPQIWLPCQHVFDIEYLDNLCGIGALYVLKNGVPVSGKVSRIPQTNLKCPMCQASFSDVKRYALIKQLPFVQDTIERLYSKAGRKSDMFQMEVFRVEKVLRTGFARFCENITLLNPLDGKQDMRRVWERTEALMPEQSRITNFRDEVVGPFEICIHKLEAFFSNATILPAQVLPFKLRQDLLYYFCRCAVIEEAVRLYQHFHSFNGSNRQVEIVKIGLRMKAQDQIKGYLGVLNNSINQSKDLNLKRLEVEFRLLQVTFWLVLRHDLDLETDLDIATTLERCRVLCNNWPDSAGLFTQILAALQARYESRGKSVPIHEWNQSPLRELWRGWGSYKHTGRLEFCRFHHPYPRVAFRDCPECGREVVGRAMPPKGKSGLSEDSKMDSCLQDDKFRAMIKKLRIERDGEL